MSKELAQTVRSKKIAALVAILTLFAMFAFTQNGGTAHAQNASNDAVVTISADLAITGIDVTGVDINHPPGLAASAFPGTWTTIDTSLNTTVTAVESNTLRDSRYVIASDPAATAGPADTTNSSVFGVNNTTTDITVVTVARTAALAVLATLFVSAMVIVVSSIARTMRSSRTLSATSRWHAITNANNRWLNVLLATLGTMISTTTAAATYATLNFVSNIANTARHRTMMTALATATTNDSTDNGQRHDRRCASTSFATARDAGHPSFSTA